MSDIFDRAFEIASATFPRAPRDRLAHPFGFDDHPPYRWRVSRDVWDALCAEVWPELTVSKDPISEDRLLGEPIDVDETLPPNSMLLERVIQVQR